MDQLQALRALAGLQAFIRDLAISSVHDKAQFKDWRREHEKFMEDCFGYVREDGMPSITNLVSPFFHPTMPLIGLNYTPVAHNTLHAFPRGWTPALRLCRGIVFDRSGQLVAKPFEKFFNYREHPETTDLPNEPFVATVKHDGHLGIGVWHEGRFLTSRGDFESRTSKLADRMLKSDAALAAKLGELPKDITPLFEIIHPQTKVHLKYRKARLILIGAYRCSDLHDFDYNELKALGKRLGVEVTDRWSGDSLADLVKLTQDLSVKNREGFVVRFQSGLRVKFKFATYINLMVAAKLSYGYVMNRMLAGNLEKMTGNLPEEIHAVAMDMLRAVRQAKTMPGTVKERRQYLYGLVPPAESTPYFRGICRKVLKLLDAE